MWLTVEDVPTLMHQRNKNHNMGKFPGFILCCFIQCVAFIGFVVGCNYVPELMRIVRAAINREPWQLPELARLVACVCGPILMAAGLTVCLYWFVYTSSRLRMRIASFPDQPWLWREDWQAKQIRLSNRAAVGFLTAATLTFLLIFVPLGIYLASLKNSGMVHAFLVALALFLVFFIRQQWVNRIRNRSVLNLETLPGRINGSFSGLVTIPLSFPAGTTFHVRLRCEVTLLKHARHGNTNDSISVLTNTQNSQSRSHSQTSIVYDDAKLVTPEPSQVTPRSTSVPVSFAIPDNLPSTGTITEAAGSGTATTRHYSWSVRIRLTNETDLREIVFEIPVFKDGQNRAS
jgi:hypothetical protein